MIATAPPTPRNQATVNKAEAVKAEVELARARNALAIEKLKARNIKQGAKVLGDYSSARRTRLRDGWLGVTKSANAHLDALTLERMRADSQRAERNYPIARGIIDRVVDYVSGGGPKVQPLSSDAGWNKATAEAFNLWGEHYADASGRQTLGQMCDTGARRWTVDGDICFLKTAPVLPERGGAEGLNIGSLQMIESARLITPTGADKRRVINGVEMDEWGRAVAYHVAEFSPWGPVMAGKTRRIDAGDVMMLVSTKRPGQVRGEPAFAALAQHLEWVDKYIEATVISSRVAACQALVIKKNFPAEAQTAMLGETQDRDDGEQERWEELQPGAIRYLEPNEDAVSFTPNQPGTQFDPFVRTLMRLIGMDVGLPLEAIYLDFSQANFYGQRAAMAQSWMQVERKREDLFADVLRPVYRWVVGSLIARGKLPYREDWWKHRWIGRPRPSVDPGKETEATKAAIDANLMTREQALQERGLDYDQVIERRAVEKEKEAALGVTPPGMPGAKTDGPAGNDANNEDDASKKPVAEAP